MSDELSTVEVCRESPATADARWCVGNYCQELAQRFDSGFDPTQSNPASEEEMSFPHGCFVIARIDGRPAGCGALKRKDSTTAEIKRMWTAPWARRKGIARAILLELEAAARDLGLTVLHLETNQTLIEAQRLYCSMGFQEVPAFNDEKYAHHWFEKRL
jgi:ribosomal protein S18 acetylase RimI-like enzyme